MKKKWWGAVVILMVVIVGWMLLARTDGHLLWTRSYGANTVKATLSPEGRLVVAAAKQIEVINGDGKVETLLTRPTEILEFVNQHDTGFLIIDRFEGREWLRKYSWSGEPLWEQSMSVRLRQIKSSQDGHFAGVINNRELALFDPNGNLLWKKSDAPRRFECLGFTSSNTIAYRNRDIDNTQQQAAKTIQIVNLEGHPVNDAQLKNPHQVPQIGDSGTITAVEGNAVALFDSEAGHLWTRSQHDTMPATNRNSFMDPWRLVYVSPRTNVFVEQPNGSISMYHSTGELAWSYGNIQQMPTRRSSNTPTDEDVLLFSYPDAFLSTGRQTPMPMFLPSHTWIAELNSDGSLNWKQEIPGERHWFLPRSIDGFRSQLRSGFRSSFYPVTKPLRDRDGMVYVVGMNAKGYVVHAYRGE